MACTSGPPGFRRTECRDSSTIATTFDSMDATSVSRGSRSTRARVLCTSWSNVSRARLTHNPLVLPRIVVRIGASVLQARLEPDRSPHTVDAFVARLPWRGQLVHARWSGEALWMPLGDTTLYESYEDPT